MLFSGFSSPLSRNVYSFAWKLVGVNW